MCSFDSESLYTNIPVSETIDIILNKNFPNPNETYNGFNRSEFEKLLHLALHDSYFRFNGKIFKQKDGFSMGAPLSQIIANIFLCDFEKRAFRQCDTWLIPRIYRRFLDDTFILFDNHDQSKTFFEFFNGFHQNINFTYENEINGKLSFRDINIVRDDNSFIT